MANVWTFSIGGMRLDVHGVYMDGKPKLATKLIVDGRHVSFINGVKFYSTRVQNGSRYYGERWQGHVPLIRAAIALGMLPKGKTLLRVAKVEEARRERVDQAYAADDTIRAAERAGVTLPQATVRLLKRKARALPKSEDLV